MLENTLFRSRHGRHAEDLRRESAEGRAVQDAAAVGARHGGQGGGGDAGQVRDRPAGGAALLPRPVQPQHARGRGRGPRAGRRHGAGAGAGGGGVSAAHPDEPPGQQPRPGHHLPRQAAARPRPRHRRQAAQEEEAWSGRGGGGRALPGGAGPARRPGRAHVPRAAQRDGGGRGGGAGGRDPARPAAQTLPHPPHRGRRHRHSLRPRRGKQHTTLI